MIFKSILMYNIDDLSVRTLAKVIRLASRKVSRFNEIKYKGNTYSIKRTPSNELVIIKHI